MIASHPDAPEAILQVNDLFKAFPLKKGWRDTSQSAVRAVDGVSFEVSVGETLGIVGESGSGKSTMARLLMGLEVPTAGEASLSGLDLFDTSPSTRRRCRRLMQMVFQDPYSSLDPRMTIYQLVSEPWVIHRGVVDGNERRDRVVELLRRVGLNPSDMDRLSGTFSGGQRQRIGIARALALSPKVLILDEPVSALDVSIQAQIVELLRQLQDEFGLAMIFIAHDLAVVRSLAHRVGVMYLGRLVELDTADRIYGDPQHPYTRALLSSIPTAHVEGEPPRRIKLAGDIPSVIDQVGGCRFHPRCWLRNTLGNPSICEAEDPPAQRLPGGGVVACHFVGATSSGETDPVASVDARTPGSGHDRI